MFQNVTSKEKRGVNVTTGCYILLIYKTAGNEMAPKPYYS